MYKYLQGFKYFHWFEFMVIYSLIASWYLSAINTKKLYNITYFPSGVYLKDLHNSISKECTYWKLWIGNLEKKLSYFVLVQINASNIACSKFNAVTISSRINSLSLTALQVWISPSSFRKFRTFSRIPALAALK